MLLGSVEKVAPTKLAPKPPCRLVMGAISPLGATKYIDKWPMVFTLKSIHSSMDASKAALTVEGATPLIFKLTKVVSSTTSG